MGLLHVILIVVTVFTLIVGVVDAQSGHIPNRLLLWALPVGVGLHVASFFFARAETRSAMQALLAASLSVFFGTVVCAVVPLLLFRVNALGGGDVKLLAWLGATLGPFVGLEIELYAFVLLALFALARLAYQGALLRSLATSATLLANPLLPRARRREVPKEMMTALPFGPAVFAAAVIVSALRWSGS